MSNNLNIQKLTPEAFKPFGEVIEAADYTNHFPINEGSTERYHDLANIDPGAAGKAIVSIFRGQPRELPMAITMMERHPLASQAFIPLGPNPYLVIVARPGKAPEITDLQAFYCENSQGVNYAKGVWHHPLLALKTVSDFLVIDRSGPGDNCDIVQLDQSISINCYE